MENKKNLEIELLTAQIAAAKRNGSLQSSFLAVLLAIVTSIIASVVVGVFITFVGENYLESKLSEIKELRENVSQLQQSMVLLRKEKEEVASELTKIMSKNASYDQGVEINLEISAVTPGADKFQLESSTPNVQIQVYPFCPGKFVFPEGAPPFGVGACQPDDEIKCEQSANRTICTFGPYSMKGTFEVGYWILAKAGGKRAIRYVSLSGL